MAAPIKMTKWDERVLKVLLKIKRVPEDDVGRIRSIMKRSQLTLEQVLQDLGYVSERDLLKIKAKLQGYAFVDLSKRMPSPDIVQLIPEDLALRHRVLALEVKNDVVMVASSNPGDVEVADLLGGITKKRIEMVLASAGEIAKKIGEYHDHYKSARVQRLIRESTDQGKGLAAKMGMTVSLESTAGEQSATIRTLNLLLLQSLIRRTSDIHLTPTANALLVQYRIDGVLETVQQLPKSVGPEVINRIKILSSLDIAERRLPQDGSFHIEVEGREIDFRVATTPTIYGEKAVLRILDKQATLLGLENLGFNKKQYLRLRRALRRPNGIILVAGPTGSGKTTTLYAALDTVNNGRRNITTIEDPVEYQIEGVTQIQVEDEIGLTFARILRSVLRQDPDVVLVGEIRDQETAENAVRASLTGHLVLATVHSNDAVSAVSRLTEMGIPPFLLASSLRAVVSQRLVRSFCANCKETAAPDPALLSVLPAKYRDIEKVATASGCNSCFNTGYRGRLVVSEVLVMTDGFRQAITDGAVKAKLQEAAIRSGMVPIFDDGMEKVALGLTSLDEVIASTHNSDEDEMTNDSAEPQGSLEAIDEPTISVALESPAEKIPPEVSPF